mgnify:CR=1 FL=1
MAKAYEEEKRRNQGLEDVFFIELNLESVRNVVMEVSTEVL